MTQGNNHHAVVRWVLALLSALLVAVAALGYERSMKRADDLATSVGAVREDVRELRTSYEAMTAVDAEQTKRLDKIDEKLEAIWQELR